MRMMRTTAKWIAVAAAGGALSACASSAPSEQLVEARRTYDLARTSKAAQLVPAEVLEAQQALERAEAAHAEDANSFEERSTAYVAQRKAQEAMVQAEIAEARLNQERWERQYTELQDELRRRARSELEQTRMNLRDIENQLGAVRQELSDRSDTLGERAQELQRLEQELEARKAELEQQREARQQAEQKYQAAMQSLQELGTLKEEQRGLVLTLTGAVLFRTAQADLLPIAEQKLNRVAEALKMQEGTIVIEGHTDSRGADEMNQRLSQERAESVRQYLISQGVDPDRVRAVGRGEQQPIATNDTAEGRAMNRRVEIVIPNGGSTPALEPNAPSSMP